MLPREVIAVGPLVLRPPVETDAPEIQAVCDDPSSARHLPLLPSPYTLEDAHAYVRRAKTVWESGGAEFAITQDGRYAGSAGVRPLTAYGTTGIDLLVAPWARGRDVAATVARGLTEWLLDHGVERVELEAEVEDLPALRAALHAGFTEEGRRRDAKALRDGRRTDLVSFGRLARDGGEPVEQALPFFEGGFEHGELGDGVVRLTPLTVADAGDFHRLLHDPGVARFGVLPENSPEDIERRCRATGYLWLTGRRIELTVRDPKGAFAGHLQLLHSMPDFGEGMIGYSLLPEFRGSGLMTRAVRLLSDWVFAHTSLHRLVAGTDAANTASQAVLERSGFAREGVRPEFFPQPGGRRSDEISWLRLRPASS
ncbi:GNAT family N-acetyltransferase [Nonomuraea sp. MCN248]|uniref:GNAT family N-acetyltransferase n=1 Tax=Nonomuraea corallina TaxID=2989783 RepID=A0ABT4SAW0_9ACTN|nr:GNAT family N-acetyltransferase [Nonomuraea corallina]MDA0634347.1 GNAT family N-acetyltransferase [Nonomuraea corallina]